MIIDGKEFKDEILDAAFEKLVLRKPASFILSDLVVALGDAGVTGLHPHGFSYASELANRFLQKKRKAGALTYVHKGRLWKPVSPSTPS